MSAPGICEICGEPFGEGGACVECRVVVLLNGAEYDYLPEFVRALQRGEVPDEPLADFVVDALANSACVKSALRFGVAT